MKKKLLAPLLVMFFPVLLSAQSLDFETLNPRNNMPVGWSASSPAVAYPDSLIKRSGNYSLLIDGEPQSFAMMRGSLLHAGDTVCLRGYIKVNALVGNAKVVFSLFGSDHIVSKHFVVSNDTGDDWVMFELKSALCTEILSYGIFCRLNGVGKIWLDDLSLTIDGKPLSGVGQKTVGKIKYKAADDRQFDKGSGFAIPKQLSPAQVENLNALARVWGLLKYYHPAVARGDYNWDYELFRIMPKVYDADANKRNKLLLEWVESLGAFEKDDNNLNEGVSWVGDTKRFGAKLSQKLVEVSTSKRGPFHYYFYPAFLTGVPTFCNEATYANMNYGDAGMRLLGVFRLWNVIEFFYPYRYMTDDRDAMLSEALRTMFSPGVDNMADYQTATGKLLCGLHDSHVRVVDHKGGGNLTRYALPFITKTLVEGKFVVAHTFGKPGESNLLKNDAITHIDGQSVADVIEKHKHLFPASNRNKLEQIVAVSSVPYVSDKESVTYTVDREGSITEVEVKAYPLAEWTAMVMEYQKNISRSPGVTHKIYEDSVAYISLGIDPEEMKNIAKEYLSYPRIVIDNRFTGDEEVFDMLTRLLPGCLPVARFRYADPNRPGNFIEIEGGGDYYAGSNDRGSKVVVIVDHTTQSYMEFTTMMLQNIPGMITLGNQTSGADGNVTHIFLPGEIQAFFTGLDCFYPDGGRCQGVGVRIDEVVTPTLKGIREGRDELLERAIEMVKQHK